ncbi:peptide chain release factor 1, mitochondrial isoform X3 [Numida meleagris]|uniref:peptide chain release factor 1, mitochondrial isoform X3 n=1 Tax=Numida meleagris TaxID=8996 RepID=UPI000B3DF79A|nr:peptide chain release factor 1, mitochondrial isoform X3 [Numida meleagris]
MKPPRSVWLFKNLLSGCYCYGLLRNCPLPSVAKRISCVMRLHSCGFWRPESLLDTARFTLSFHGQLRKKHQDSRALWKHEAVQKYLETLSKEYQQVNSLLNADSKNEFEQRTLRRRRADLSPVATAFQEIKEAESELQELETMCRGDICQQFTKEMFEMYQNYADYKCWTFDILNYVPAEIGGLHHAAAHISGDDVYRHLKYEGGTHRVQRIPETGLSSRMQRIHTGTMSVIVLPQPEEVDVKVDPKDLRIDTFRAKGAGGQHVNKTDSAVRIVHLPTGVVVECQQERSQQMNKEIALQTLRAKLYQQIIEKQLSREQSARKLQLGTRAQSERIRTYNFTQDRVTDHRISYDARNIKEILSGKEELDKLINRLLEFAEMEAVTEYLENLQSVGGGGC